ITGIFRVMVDAMAAVEGADLRPLSRWFRCLIQMSLDGNAPMTDDIIEQVIRILGVTSDVYPVEELEWLSITIFNRAVDFLNDSLHVQANELKRKALLIAGFGDDDGKLLEQLLDVDFAAP
ncbi:MAG: hypothetical protein M1838_004186, partial [Thelocarpon superellum]